jgi:hypothetical protein
MEKHASHLSAQWREIRDKINSILLSSKAMTIDKARSLCTSMDTSEDETRRRIIKESWGPLYLHKCAPLLYQLNMLEKHIKATTELKEKNLSPMKTLIGEKPKPTLECHEQVVFASKRGIFKFEVGSGVLPGTAVAMLFENEASRIPYAVVEFKTDQHVEVEKAVASAKVKADKIECDYRSGVFIIPIAPSVGGYAKLTYEQEAMLLDDLSEDDLEA